MAKPKLKAGEYLNLSIGLIDATGRAREDLGDLENLAKSIKEKGIIQPLVIDTNYRLLAGGRRFQAAQEAGLSIVPVSVRKADELDALEIELLENIERKDFTWVERARLEKRIYDHRKAKDPSWSMNKQSDLLDQSKGATVRRLQLAEAMEALPDLADEPDQETAWKKYKKIEEKMLTEALAAKNPKAQEAAKWAKDHYIIGDALQELEAITPGVCDFAEVDPPYAIELDKRKEKAKDGRMDVYNEISSEEYPSFIGRIAEAVHSVLGNNTFCVWWFGSDWYATVLAALREVGFSVNPVPGLWYKGQQGQTSSPDTMLASSYEPFFLCRKGQPKLRKPGRSNVFHFSPTAPQKKIHPTERPLDLMLEMFDTFCLPGSRIVVPFLGSGVTLRAAYKRNLVGFGYDLDDRLKERFLTRVKQDVLGDEGDQPAERSDSTT